MLAAATTTILQQLLYTQERSIAAEEKPVTNIDILRLNAAETSSALPMEEESCA